MKLVITIDTEEDDWSNYSRQNYSLRNIERIPFLQDIFDRFDARPTYLINYPVATNQKAISVLKKILEKGRCEIGAHCHPWNTPPFEEELSPFNSMLSNLPEILVVQKITTLHETIIKNYGVTPTAFRAGRWGMSPAVARAIMQLGYCIDTSVTPSIDWRGYSGPNFEGYQIVPYRFHPDNPQLATEGAPLLEIPATIGFIQKSGPLLHTLLNRIFANRLKMLHIEGILERLNLYNNVWLSPELSSAPAMIALAKRLRKNRQTCLNMAFHTTTLIAGLTPFVKSAEDELMFLKRIETFLSHAKTAGDEFIFLSEMNQYY